MINNDCKIPLYIGTIGFSYTDWSGSFYPSDMTSKNFLAYYSRIFNSVEIDSTFYGTPKRSTVQRWITSTPQEFKISVKIPQSITHSMVMADTWGLVNEFLGTISILDKRLGVILLQFPPSFTINRIDELFSFISRLPRTFQYAIEVRHSSWYTEGDRFADLLRSNHIAWAATQYPNLPETIHVTSDFSYIRWIGQHGSFLHHQQERIDRTIDFQRWWQQIQQICGQVNELFGYFNNDYAGFAAGSALRFRSFIGEPVDPSRQPKQAKLF